MLITIFILLIISALTGATYNVFLKKSPEKLLFSFWVAIFTFLGMTIAFYKNQYSHGMCLTTITDRIFTLATENSLNYVIVSLVLTLSIALKAYLFNCYNLSKIIPILKIGTPLTALLYFFLGDSLTTNQVVGIGLISFGAFISGFDRFHYPNIFKPLFNLPFYLYIGALAMALLDTSENLIVYLTTEANPTTQKVINFFHAQGLTHFTNQFVIPLEYFQVSSFFFIVIFFLYILFATKKSCFTILKEFRAQKKAILLASLANFVSQYLYYFTYQGNDQALVVAFSKFSVPITLAFAYLTLKEKIQLPELVGVGLIIVGGIIGAF